MMSKWEAFEYQTGDETKILRLFREVFGFERSLEHWKWEFLDSPAGRGITYLAKAEDRVVGQYTVVPVEMVVRGRTVMGAQSVDTMTANDFRRQGIFEQLAKLTLKAARELGVEIIYGFPNQNSYPGLVGKLDFLSVAPVGKFRQRLDWKRLAVDKHPKSIVKSVAKEYFKSLRATEKSIKGLERCQRFTEEHDDLWKRVSKSVGLCVAKTSSYLNWRYCKRPNSTYRILQIRDYDLIVGVAIWNQDGINATFVDMIADSETVAKRLKYAVVREARKRGCKFLQGWELCREGRQGSMFRDSPLVAEPWVLVAISPTRTFAKQDLSIEAGWQIHMGDSDGI